MNIRGKTPEELEKDAKAFLKELRKRYRVYDRRDYKGRYGLSFSLSICMYKNADIKGLNSITIGCIGHYKNQARSFTLTAHCDRDYKLCKWGRLKQPYSIR